MTALSINNSFLQNYQLISDGWRMVEVECIWYTININLTEKCREIAGVICDVLSVIVQL